MIKHVGISNWIYIDNTPVYKLDLKNDSILRIDDHPDRKQLNYEILLKCFCEARKTQAFFTKCLDENSTEAEKELIAELVKEYAKASNKILEYCNSFSKK
ncbi:hypothetical protein [Anoxybacteroides tepidamans]|uniref:hypothetical protein n=1 Tax=Anoxybacteroides tepidamans TaxID=265948 RepID=UPI00048736AA|nr:hypothetical protein [Anoxybacillus tepidamans]